MRHWLCVTGYHNWTVIEQKNVWGVDERYRITMERYVSPQDGVCFYVTPDNRAGLPYKSESRGWKSSIAGTFQTKKHGDKCCYFEDLDIGWIDPEGKPKTYPYRVDLERMDMPKAPIAFNQQLKEELVFITDKTKSWGHLFFRRWSLYRKKTSTLRSWIRRTWQ